MMKQSKCALIASVAIAAAALSPAAFADENPALVIENYVGTIDWQNGDRLTVKDIENKDDTHVDEDGHLLKIDGGIDRPDKSNCKGYSGRYSIDLGWKKSGQIGGYKDLEDYPKVTVTVPENASIEIRNAIIFTLGEPNIGSLDAELMGCGNLYIGDASDYIRIESNGSSDLTAGNTPRAEIAMRGSGDVELGNVGAAKIKLSGSGDVDLGSVETFEISLSGSGDVEAGNIGSGEISIRGSGDVSFGDASGNILASSSGSGDMEFGDIAGDLAFEGRGSGDLNVDSVNGRLSVQTRGSGDASIDGGSVSTLLITAGGSSSVDFEGTASEAELRASGAADITVDRVTGKVAKSKSGSADIKVRNQD